ncbi:helicase associated domain-containing protein [Streptomyces sp. NPDC046866]|uniref:helicase associated domain-containing protein n=1 Tax=Streptomyces sp. NPDC046866 TaxID=3154921 RepID=UPI003452C04E
MRGYWAARRGSALHGHLRVPLGAEMAWGYPLGRWIRRQGPAYAFGLLEGAGRRGWSVWGWCGTPPRRTGRTISRPPGCT